MVYDFGIEYLRATKHNHILLNWCNYFVVSKWNALIIMPSFWENAFRIQRPNTKWGKRKFLQNFESKSLFLFSKRFIFDLKRPKVFFRWICTTYITTTFGRGDIFSNDILSKQLLIDWSMRSINWKKIFNNHFKIILMLIYDLKIIFTKRESWPNVLSTKCRFAKSCGAANRNAASFVER